MIRAREGALSSVERWKMVMKMMREVSLDVSYLNLARRETRRFWDWNSGGQFVALSTSFSPAEKTILCGTVTHTVGIGTAYLLKRKNLALIRLF